MFRYAAGFAIVVTFAALGVSSAQSGGALLSAPLKKHPKLPAARPKGSCHANGKLQDRNCTPGVINPGVTQANIQKTICVSGWADAAPNGIRPKYAPVSYTDALKKQQIVEYGYTDTDVSHYEEDHLISLELGGHPNDPRNLWPESPQSPNPKDAVEDRLKKEVCAGTITLAEAQREISTDWTTAK